MNAVGRVAKRVVDAVRSIPDRVADNLEKLVTRPTDEEVWEQLALDRTPEREWQAVQLMAVTGYDYHAAVMALAREIAFNRNPDDLILRLMEFGEEFGEEGN